MRFNIIALVVIMISLPVRAENACQEDNILDCVYNLDNPGSVLQYIDEIERAKDRAQEYLYSGRYHESLRLNLLVLASHIAHADLGQNHPMTFHAMNNLANSYGSLGHIDKSLQMHQEVLNNRLDHKDIGPNHPDTYSSLSNIANLYDNSSRHDEALKLKEQIVDFRVKNPQMGPEHPYTLRAMHNLGFTYHVLKMFDKALELQLNTLKVSHNHPLLGYSHPETLGAIINLSKTHLSLKQNDKLPELANRFFIGVQGRITDKSLTLDDKIGLLSVFSESYQWFIKNTPPIGKNADSLNRQHKALFASFDLISRLKKSKNNKFDLSKNEKSKLAKVINKISI